MKTVETTGPPLYQAKESYIGGHGVNGAGSTVTCVKSRASIDAGVEITYSRSCEERNAGSIETVAVAQVSIS